MTSKTRNDIQYPMAYSISEQRIISISEAPEEGGWMYSCVHCNQRMSAVVQVSLKSPHFRHTAPELQCDPDLALHTYTIRMIQQAHAEAQETGGEYKLTRPCKAGISGCRNHATNINLAKGWECTVETSIVPHTRSDLVFTHPDGGEIAVEVVNTHDMEPETEAAYKIAGTPVAIIPVEWAKLERLFAGLSVNDSRNFNGDICNKCDEKRLEVGKRLDRRKLYVNNVLSGMTRQQEDKPLFRPWYEANGSLPMYPSTQRKVFANAIILTELGFKQHKWKKPWLFRFVINREYDVVLYADLGGSYLIPIYKDTAATLDVSFGRFLRNDITTSELRRYIIEEFGKLLQEFGVDVRTESLSAGQVKRVGVQPLKKVDSQHIERLVSWKHIEEKRREQERRQQEWMRLQQERTEEKLRKEELREQEMRQWAELEKWFYRR